jgi:hypothetical protein
VNAIGRQRWGSLNCQDDGNPDEESKPSRATA